MDANRLNSRGWVRYFESNRLGRPKPCWDIPCAEEAVTAAARTPTIPTTSAALGLFVAEGQEHARLLAALVARFGGTLIAAWQAHWLPLERALWAVQLQAFLLGAGHAAWLDHRPALAAMGVDRRAFLRQVRGECRVFLGVEQRLWRDRPSSSSWSGSRARGRRRSTGPASPGRMTK